MIILTKRIVSLILVLCLLVSILCVTSSAVYEINEDTTVYPFMLLSSELDPASIDSSDLAAYLEYGGYSAARYLAYILYALTGSTSSMSNSVYSFLDSIDDQLLDQYTLLGLINSALITIRGNSNSISLDVSSLDDSVSLIQTSTSGINSLVQLIYTSFGNSLASISSNTSLLSHLIVPAGTFVPSGSGSVSLSSDSSFWEISNSGLKGVIGNLISTEGNAILHSNGQRLELPSTYRFSAVFNRSMLGLRRILVGDQTGTSWRSILWDNNNSSSTVSLDGLGPLINGQLNSLGENLAHLAFMFASDDDIKLKQDSQPLLDEADSFYDDSSESNIKVSAGNVGSLKGIANNFSGALDTGANIEDAFSIVSNSNSFRWFSSETLQSIDSVGVASASDPYSVYEQLHDDFNSVYFPDRE